MTQQAKHHPETIFVESVVWVNEPEYPKVNGKKMTNPQKRLWDMLTSMEHMKEGNGHLRDGRWFVADRCDFGLRQKTAFWQLRDAGLVEAYRDTQGGIGGWYVKKAAIARAEGRA